MRRNKSELVHGVTLSVSSRFSHVLSSSLLVTEYAISEMDGTYVYIKILTMQP